MTDLDNKVVIPYLRLEAQRGYHVIWRSGRDSGAVLSPRGASTAELFQSGEGKGERGMEWGSNIANTNIAEGDRES
jgi:hypothetical protein